MESTAVFETRRIKKRTDTRASTGDILPVPPKPAERAAPVRASTVLPDELDRFRDFLGKSTRDFRPRTIVAYIRGAELYLGYLRTLKIDPEEATERTVPAFLVYLVDELGNSPRTANARRAAVERYYRFRVLERGLKNYPMHDVKELPIDSSLPAIFSRNEIDGILALPIVTEIWGARDQALFWTLYSTGAKLAEVASMTMENVNLAKGFALVHGRNTPARKVFFCPEARGSLEVYLGFRCCFLSDPYASGKPRPSCPAVFINWHGQPLGERGIEYIFDQYLKRLSFRSPVTVSSFRHTYATHLMDSGADVLHVGALLGHKAIRNTLIYEKTSMRRLGNIIDRCHPHGRVKETVK
jgi:integrase/recombinase XerC